MKTTVLILNISKYSKFKICFIGYMFETSRKKKRFCGLSLYSLVFVVFESLRF